MGLTLARLGVGPVFVYDCITATRRWQGYAARSCFLMLLLAVLVVMWQSVDVSQLFPIRSMAALGQAFYVGVASTQLALVMLTAPAATAGAICLDRARGTLTHLLMTDLSNVEIVLGKLAARLVPVFCLLACTLPMMELLTLIGGVDPDLLWKGFAVSAGMAVLGCSLAMLFSLWVAKTHEALLLTYAVWLLWLLAGPMLGTAAFFLGWIPTGPPRTADPFFLVLAPYWSPKSVVWSDYFWFLAETGTVSALLIVIAIARIRAVCTRETVMKPSPAAKALRRQTIWKVLMGRIPWLSPSLDRNPVVWREWNRSRPSRGAAAVIWLYIILSLFFSIAVMAFPEGRIGVFLNGFQVAIGLLLLSVTAATALAEERVRGSLDLLMSTTLSTREIVMGKWLGVYRSVPLLAILPTLVIGVLAYEMSAGPWWAPAMAVYVLCAGAAVTSLGLALATRLPRVGQAVGATVSLYVGFTVGWFFLMLVAFRGWGERPAMLSPFMWPAEMTYEVTETRTVVRHTGWAIMATVVAAWFALEVLVSTLGAFDRRLGRVPDGSTVFIQRSTTMRILIAIYLVLVVFMAFWSGDGFLFSQTATFQFALGTFLTAAGAASDSRAVRIVFGAGSGAGDGRGAAIDVPLARAILVKWLAALRLLLPGMIPAWFVVVLHLDRIGGFRESLWREIAITVAYKLAAGALAASIGVALWVRLRGGRRPVIMAIAVWALLNLGYLTFAWAVAGEQSRQGLSMSSPLFGVLTLALAVGRSTAFQVDPMPWAINWIVVFSVVATGLLIAARADRSAVVHQSIALHSG